MPEIECRGAKPRSPSPCIPPCSIYQVPLADYCRPCGLWSRTERLIHCSSLRSGVWSISALISPPRLKRGGGPPVVASGDARLSTGFAARVEGGPEPVSFSVRQATIASQPRRHCAPRSPRSQATPPSPYPLHAHKQSGPRLAFTFAVDRQVRAHPSISPRRRLLAQKSRARRDRSV